MRSCAIVVMVAVSFLLGSAATGNALTASASLDRCQKTVQKESAKYSRRRHQTVARCLRAISGKVVKGDQAAPIDVSGATRSCLAQLFKLGRTDGKAPVDRMQVQIEKFCDPASNTHSLDDILGSPAPGVNQPLEVGGLGTYCARLAVGSGSLSEWIGCLQAAAECHADQKIVVEFPRALEWLNLMDSEFAASVDVRVAEAQPALRAVEVAIDGTVDDDVAEIECGPAPPDPPCPPGQTRSAGVCVDCAAGTSNVDGVGACETCAAGTFATTTGSSTCVDCSVGRFQAATGATTCVDCAAGGFQSRAGQSYCSDCSPGTYTASAGLSVCTNCVPGTFQAASSGTMCLSCLPGFFQSFSGQSSCPACAPGAFTATTGSSACTDCPVGTSQASSGGTACVNCALGTFQGAPGQASCIPCAAGTFAFSTGSSTCTGCPAGTFQSLSGQTSCANCAPDEYNPTIGQTACFPCTGAPVGETSCTCSFP